MNSAHRIREILRRLQSFGGGQSTAASVAWEHALQIDVPPEEGRDEVTDTALQALRGEVSMICAALSDLGVPRDLFHDQLQGLNHYASSRRMGDPWQAHSSTLLAPELKTVLGWAAHVLPDTEAQLDDESLSDLLEAIAHLEDCLKDARVPATTRAFMTHQVGLMRRAVFLYPICGVQGIKRATAEIMGHAFTDRQTLDKDLAESPEATVAAVSVWHRFVSKAAQACDKADRVDKLAETGMSLYNKTMQAIEWAGPMLKQLVE